MARVKSQCYAAARDAAAAAEVSFLEPWKPAFNVPPAASGTSPRSTNPPVADSPTLKTARSAASPTCCTLRTTIPPRNVYFGQSWSERSQRPVSGLREPTDLSDSRRPETRRWPPVANHSRIQLAARYIFLSDVRGRERTLPYGDRLQCWQVGQSQHGDHAI